MFIYVTKRIKSSFLHFTCEEQQSEPPQKTTYQPIMHLLDTKCSC